MVRCISLIVALLVVSSAISGAASARTLFRPQGTPEEKACYGDSHRLCRDAIPDQFKVLACLQEHRARLSKACAEVLQTHGM